MPGFVMADQEFFAAATFAMASRFEDYLQKKEETETGTEIPDGTEIDGRRVYLCLKAGEETAAMLDALDRHQSQAAFFCTPAFLENQGDLLRRMAATGQSIGILADGGDTERSVEEQLEAGNRALEEAELDRSGYDLHTASNAASLLRRISTRRGNVAVWLGDRASAAGLRAFLMAAGDAEGRCLAWTETA